MLLPNAVAIFAQFVWWPWGYWVMGIVCFVLAGIGFLVIPTSSRCKTDHHVNLTERLEIEELFLIFFEYIV